MNSPFDRHRTEVVGTAQPGDMLTVTTKDGKTVCITRTGRPYSDDLADAYNAAIEHVARERGLEWFTTPSGELKIGFSQASTRENFRQIEQKLEVERARYARSVLPRAA